MRISEREENVPFEVSTFDLEMFLGNDLPRAFPIVVLSDFDETLCNTYEYDQVNKLHTPQLEVELLEQVKKMKSRLIIATSRSPKEAIVQQQVAKLAKDNTPIVCENGAVLYFPREERVEVLATDRDLLAVNRIKSLVAQTNWAGEFPEHEVLISTDRFASFEIRVQDPSGRGDPRYYAFLRERLLTLGEGEIESVSSQSSLSVHPKGFTKATGFSRALDSLGIRRESCIVIGMGDGANDVDIFNTADLSIAVASRVGQFATITCNEGEKAALSVLRAAG